MIKPRVLFLCTGNSCRTQMAEGFLRHLAEDRFDVTSAGNHATAVHPEVIEAMREAGIDISRQRAKKVDPLLGERFSFVITLCDREREKSCPIFPGAIWRLQWTVDNPAMAHSREEYRAMVRRVRDQIQRHVAAFVSEHQ